MHHLTGCLICGEQLVYAGVATEHRCAICGTSHMSEAACVEGHFVCDACHSLVGNERIERVCLASEERDPVLLASLLMRQPGIAMHGPEHHFLVPAVLLTSVYNGRETPQLKGTKLRQARKRAETVVGGACGFLGACGAGIGTGIFVSLVTEATPLSREEWGLSNRMTAEALSVIAAHGGPRCCKRDTYLALRAASDFARRELQIEIPISGDLLCEFSERNAECLLADCPYHPERETG
jgi:hypothetical protein